MCDSGIVYFRDTDGSLEHTFNDTDVKKKKKKWPSLFKKIMSLVLIFLENSGRVAHGGLY